MLLLSVSLKRILPISTRLRWHKCCLLALVLPAMPFTVIILCRPNKKENACSYFRAKICKNLNFIKNYAHVYAFSCHICPLAAKSKQKQHAAAQPTVLEVNDIATNAVMADLYVHVLVCVYMCERFYDLFLRICIYSPANKQVFACLHST